MPNTIRDPNVFLTPLVLTPIEFRRWMLSAPFCVQTQAAGLITVPAGFVTDLTSLPSFLWWESLPSDYAEAAVPHDYLYKGHLPRDVADKVYRELAGALGMPSRMVALRYYALRAFGGRAYKPYQQVA